MAVTGRRKADALRFEDDPDPPEQEKVETVRTFALWILAHYTGRSDDRVHVASHGGLKVKHAGATTYCIKHICSIVSASFRQRTVDVDDGGTNCFVPVVLDIYYRVLYMLTMYSLGYFSNNLPSNKPTYSLCSMPR